MSQIAPQIRSNPFTLSHSKPMHSLAIDTIGPLHEDERGNKYIIAIIDVFSRFLELYPTADASAKSAAEAIFHHAGRFGPPGRLISDGGSQYVNEIISQFLELMGTDHHITVAYSKQENGIVERINKEIIRHLKAIIFQNGVNTTLLIAPYRKASEFPHLKSFMVTLLILTEVSYFQWMTKKNSIEKWT